MGTPLHPSLYQINTRVWLTALAQSLGRPGQRLAELSSDRCVAV